MGVLWYGTAICIHRGRTMVCGAACLRQESGSVVADSQYKLTGCQMVRGQIKAELVGHFLTH